ncbi:hypothetical protein ECA0726 [Pectobacterium atrosepticum SCRI1043]|uniref:Uncharacterized protein n=1 Tax=Pectobacterium atrosepticum (strain SCRI 1043 / ATCC BAA-672) TaxID=218491 RepID=Q6D993_PECAS|nr:hypothetical protein ECA0726 [Pectobacterium atrosepticum SCRI1043]
MNYLGYIYDFNQKHWAICDCVLPPLYSFMKGGAGRQGYQRYSPAWPYSGQYV